MHFHALPRHHSYLIYAFEKPPSTSSTGAFQAPHITGIPFTNISYFLKTKRCSCAMRRKLYFTLFVFQNPVARQLCWVFTMSSFSVKPAARKRSMTWKLRGIIQPFCLISPMRTAQNLSFFKRDSFPLPPSPFLQGTPRPSSGRGQPRDLRCSG